MALQNAKFTKSIVSRCNLFQLAESQITKKIFYQIWQTLVFGRELNGGMDGAARSVQ